MLVGKNEVIGGVEECIAWWIERRKSKLRDDLSETMSLNPFLAPLVYDLHNLQELPGLVSLLTAGHLLGGYNTAFGKLIDEKILPQVFGTRKLDKAFRRDTPPLAESCFDDIDHFVPRENDRPDLLSLKASRWTIQLGQAVGLNRSFETILKRHGEKFDRIAVGVFYGKSETLSDKYDILRGINRGANHDVVDLTEDVKVYAGREFWQWLNEGEAETQSWVLDGILRGMDDTDLREESTELLERHTTNLARNYSQYVGADGFVDWHRLLADING